VPKREYAKQDWYDVWLPELAPSPALVRSAQLTGADRAGWDKFTRRYLGASGFTGTRRLGPDLARNACPEIVALDLR
jgi:hypothetical protein